MSVIGIWTKPLARQTPRVSKGSDIGDSRLGTLNNRLFRVYYQAVVILRFVDKPTNFNRRLVPQVSFIPMTSKPKSIEIP